MAMGELAWLVLGFMVLVWLVCMVLGLPVLLVWRAQTTPAQVRAAVREISVYTHQGKTAARLLYHTRLEHRDKPLRWCVEKTIGDLVRDRR